MSRGKLEPIGGVQYIRIDEPEECEGLLIEPQCRIEADAGAELTFNFTEFNTNRRRFAINVELSKNGKGKIKKEKVKKNKGKKK